MEEHHTCGDQRNVARFLLVTTASVSVAGLVVLTNSPVAIAAAKKTTKATTTTKAVTTTKAASASTATTTTANAIAAANAFLATRDVTKKAAVTFKYTDLAGKEGSWSNFPAGAFKGRQGAKLGELTATQRAAAMAVVDSVTSDQGYQKVLGILASDDFTGSTRSSGGAVSFGSDNYYLAFYGAPSATSPWTVQFGGHQSGDTRNPGRSEQHYSLVHGLRPNDVHL